MRHFALRGEECPWRLFYQKLALKIAQKNVPKIILYYVTVFQIKVFGHVDKTSPDNSV